MKLLIKQFKDYQYGKAIPITLEQCQAILEDEVGFSDLVAMGFCYDSDYSDIMDFRDHLVMEGE